MPGYNHEEIEKKWQAYWDENGTYSCEVDESQPKYYVLDMFPYPSGAGLHIGHAVGYTATDIIARYKKMCGFNVLHPMGWDSFGLPAEKYAVRTGTHPTITTKKNINTYRKQLRSMGFFYDWSREIATSHPDYYKWTQWIFTKLYEKGLAYEAEVAVNFCPALGTVLANEEVEGGRSTEGGHEVVRMPLKQWMLKITAYADRLLQDLDLVDWPESIKTLQRNWIGRSNGVTVSFPLEGCNEELSIYTTRVDTIYGVTFMAIAPEHPYVDLLTTEEHEKVVEAYVQASRGKSDFERTEVQREKTGVFTGGYCLNPITGAKIPVWVADYVLPTYGTGAVMAVPAHDQRDYEFAKQYHLPIIEVIHGEESCLEKEAFVGEGILVNCASSELTVDGLPSAEAKERIADWLEEHDLGKRAVQYKLRDWLFSRQRYWGEPIPILHFEDGSQRVLDLDELPLVPPQLEDFTPPGDGTSVLAKAESWVNVIDPKTKKSALRETNTMPQWAGSCWYYLRFCDPRNIEAAWDAKKENYWLPVDMYVGGAEHAVLHLLYARFWHKVLYDCGLVSHLEPFHSLRNQGLVLSRSFKDRHNRYIDPVEVEEEKGVYRHKKTGEVLTTQVEKMSKSKLNGVPPDDIINEFGADAFRLAVSFIGPLEKEKIWSNDVIHGCRRFLERANDLIMNAKFGENDFVTKCAHRLVDRAKNDLDHLQFNTIIARMMEFINDISGQEAYPKQALEYFVQILALFAPHLGEEMWRHLGHTKSIVQAQCPAVDPALLIDAVVTYVVQVNGKVRGRLDLPRDRSEDELVQIAKDHPNVSRFLEGQPVKKTIVVPNKLLNFVV